MLQQLTDGGGLTAAGRGCVGWALAWLQDLLGPSWPRRQYEGHGWLPGELLMLSSHTYVLPQFLSLVVRLRAATGDPTFHPVLAGLHMGLTRADWRHLLLQLEVARAARASGAAASFEPAVPGTARKADVLIRPAGGAPTLVETSTLFRSDVDREWENYEARFRGALAGIESREGVRTVTRLTDHLDAAATTDWLVSVEMAARTGEVTGSPQTVGTAAGEVIVQTALATDRIPTFSGALQSSDGWRRLARAAHVKAQQSAGPLPAWLRLDAVDGFFQFTEWATLPWPERVGRLAAALQDVLGEVAHLDGVVLSSGLLAALDAIDPSVENVTAVTPVGTGLRRLVAPHLVRETAVIPLRTAAGWEPTVWVEAYAAESSWLDHDLAALGQPRLTACWE